MKSMRGKLSVWLLTMALLTMVSTATAQQPKKIARIGYLDATVPANASARFEAFRHGLLELGYEEGKNIVIDSRYAEGKFDRLPGLVAELVRLKVDVIVTGGPASTRPAKEGTKTIPIVMTQDSDPISNGFVASLARPGGNITGLSTLSSELSGKRMELLKEVVPKLARMAILRTSSSPGDAHQVTEMEGTARAFGVKLQFLDILAPKDIGTAFQQARKEQAHAVLVLLSPVLISHRKEVVELAAKNHVPAIYYREEFVEDGGLMSYAPNLVDLSHRAAVYVDKILKGAKPPELPVEQATKFELIINLKAAKQIGLVIPPNVLARADKVIK
jgi:ABC-type uncharacterized transport system substrate-binding protein